MKAKIQFTVDMDDIPREVSARLENVCHRYENSSKELYNVLKDINEDNILSSIEKIDKIRRELSHFDSVLEDGYNILVGFSSYKTKLYEANIVQQESTDKKDE